jgi:hypothetical protein
MFRAVRRLWRSERGKRALRLFGFELTVVIIGVLAAQQVSNWADKRSALREVEGLHDDLYRSFGRTRIVASTYLAAIPCLDSRTDAILEASARRQPVDPHMLDGARLILLGPDSISSEKAQLLRERYGNEIADTIESVEFNLQIAGDAGRALETKWFEFQRINPRFGPVSNEDWAAVRATAVEIKGLLRNLYKTAERMERQTSRLRVNADPNFLLAKVASCDQVWRTRRGYLDQGR